MNNTILPGAELLGKQLILALPESKFVSTLRRHLDEPEDVPIAHTRIIADRVFHFIGSTHVVVESGADLWALYESAEQTAWNTHLGAWADFARGHWTDRIPTVPGTYPVRDRHGVRTADHVVVRVSATAVKDTSGGFVPAGRVTTWAGQWWSLPYPPLPGCV